MKRAAAFFLFGLGLLVGAEALLRALEAAGALAPLPAAEAYPLLPDRYVKIAVIGESPVAGYGTERAFPEILAARLREEYPGRRFYVKNFGSWGTPFHPYGLEAARKALSRYDIVLVYCGLTEYARFVGESGDLPDPNK